MRWDRVLALAWARCRPAGAPARRVLPVLMYHSVTAEPEAPAAPYYRTRTHPAVFAAQMECLARHGYAGVDLETGLEWRRGGGGDWPRPVAVTFDDGLQDAFTEAWPVLARHGFSATVFLPAASIGDTRGSIMNRPCLTWAEVRQARRAGMRFGSHTATHPVLYQMGWAGIARELGESKALIEERLGEPARAFAYPYAFPEADRDYVARLTGLLQEAGYSSCATTRVGRVMPGDPPYTLRRLPVNSLDDAPLLLAKLQGAYDWVGTLQRQAKRLRRAGRGGRPDSLTTYESA